MQMGLAEFVKGAVYAALEEREVRLDGVGVIGGADFHVLASTVVDSAVTGELLTDLRIHRALIGHQARLGVGVLAKNRAKRLCRHVRDMKATGLAVALDQGHDRRLADRATASVEALVAMLVLLFAADVGLIDFNRLALATDRTGQRIAGSLAKAMKQEPSRLVVRAEHPVQLMGTHAFLAGSHELRSEQPLAQRNLAALHNGVDGDGERLAAVFALVDTRTRACAGQLGNAVAHDAAARADGAARPEQAFEMFARCVFVVEDWVAEIDFGGHCPWPMIVGLSYYCNRSTSTG